MHRFILSLFLLLTVPSAPVLADARLESVLDWVYDTMDREYYDKVSKDAFDAFVAEYTPERLKLINSKTQQTEDYIHLGAGLLVQKLKNPKDRFSNFIPPRKVQEFKDDAYAARTDLGLTGELTDQGFRLDHVQKHSQAYEFGIRAGDIIYKINRRNTLEMTPEEIADWLKPEVGSFTTLEIRFHATGNVANLTLESRSYFEETVRMNTDLGPGILLIEITHFNQKTSGDFGDILSEYGTDNIEHLILDLRNNGGGPPLATREVMSYFTAPNDRLFFIIRKNRKPFLLTSSKMPEHYRGPISVLVGPGTASAAETMAGIFKHKSLGRVIGQTTAGASYLKSVYDYTDGSTLMLVTSRTFFHNGAEFPMQGLTPDVVLDPGVDALDYAVNHAIR